MGKGKSEKNIKFLQKTKHKIIISNNKSSGLGSYTRPKTLTDYLKTEESVVPDVPSFIDDSQETINKYKRAKKNFDSNKPDLHKQKGIGDSSYMNFDFDTDLEQDVDYKDNKNTTIAHEIFHAVRIAKGLVKDRKTEEVKASQHVNKNMRNENNRRQKYGEWEIPKK